ncbi:mercuric reductase [Chitinophaga qingshengii]|uniref:Mercuric reductase n=1 Tax=Chitinophaga qingshengii TaxID=1569794 RepID=A0ABR7TGH5_9BACT|nr:mercuric reductase [Chitinophaga qingshengii]MBC9929558.1 mercuric reductase [Chitinophaga qingshengii]
MENFDAIVIGSGQGGNPLAKKMAEKGWKIALVEQRQPGGTCINDGCTPTKTMIASARIAHLLSRSDTWGIRNQGYTVDLPAIIARKNEVVQQFRNGTVKNLEKAGVTVLMGTAVFSGVKTLTVTMHDGSIRELTATHIFINTGAAPFIPEIPGLRDVPYLTSTSLQEEVKVPPELIILGGGYIALEMGQLYRRLGSTVTIVEKSAQLMSKEDPDVAAVIKKILEAEDIEVYTATTTEKISGTQDHIEVQLQTAGKSHIITGTHLLVATGRNPQTAALQLSKTNVTLDEKGYVQVNDQLETSCPGIYAIGDVKPGPAFTHISYNDHLILYKNLFEEAELSTKTRQLPYCMFTDPQLGRIGLSETSARQAGYPVKVAHLSMDKVARAIETGETAGFMKAVVHEHTGQILGAAVIGTEGGEIMSVLQMAMLGGITATQLRDMIFAHPLYAESLNNLFMTLEK